MRDHSYSVKLAMLVALYFLTGKIGLLLAVPPGYATIIWPPSGIAIGALLVCGRKLWPGIFFGSWILNSYITWSHGNSLDTNALLMAALIAVGSTAQALFAHLLVQRFLGLPLSLERGSQLIKLFLLAGPLACLVAPTIGIAALYAGGLLPGDLLLENWFTWWQGDVMGVLIVMPLVLVSPFCDQPLRWQGKTISSIPLIALLTILVPVGLTFYGWKIVSEHQYRLSQEEFVALATESEQALINRAQTYQYALLGASGFIEGSQYVSRDEWRNYVNALNVRRNFPGINGIGVVRPVTTDALKAFEEHARAEGKADFTIHPDTPEPHYVISYIEPEDLNVAAIGLDIGFEKNRRLAAEKSRDTGKSAITDKITLVQDDLGTPGFLLLHPLYKPNAPTSTVSERRAAHLGWVYAPFIARNFLKDLTQSQDKTLQIAIYDGTEAKPEHLIYNSDNSDKPSAPAFTHQKVISIMQEQWLMTWSSTASFEKAKNYSSATLILVGGLLFSLLLAVFLLSTFIHRTYVLEEQKVSPLLPLCVFTVVAALSFYFYLTLKEWELQKVQYVINEQSGQIQKFIAFQSTDKLLALQRMANRWKRAGGTLLDQWRMDAKAHVKDIAGLSAVEWVGPDYKVRQVEPLEGNESAIGLDVRYDEVRKNALKRAEQHDTISITPPIDLVQGYKAYLSYSPIHIGQRFEGFIVGIFATQALMDELLIDYNQNYHITLSHDGKEFYNNTPKITLAAHESVAPEFENIYAVHIHDKIWTVRIVPTERFIAGQMSMWPLLILTAGMLIAALLALTMRYVLIARQKSLRLALSEENMRLAMHNAPIGMALVSPTGEWLSVNPSLCKLLGYSEPELREINFQQITHADDLSADLEHVQQMLAGEINNYRMEKRYIHKDGHIIWVLLSVSLVRTSTGEPRYFIAQIQDITRNKRDEQTQQELIGKLAESNTELERFAYVASHDMQEPLRMINSFSRLLREDCEAMLNEEGREYLQFITHSAERMQVMIVDLLEYARIGSSNRKHVPVDLAMELQHVRESLQQLITDCGAVIHSDPLPTVPGNPVQLMRLLQNLISNSIKYQPSGNLPVIHVGVSETADHWTFTVSDNGLGIDAAFAQKIFEPFQRLHAWDEIKGTGIGLAICRKIVEGHGGTIWVSAAPEGGSVFHFTIAKQSSAEKS